MKKVKGTLTYVLLTCLLLTGRESIGQNIGKELENIELQMDSIFAEYNAPDQPGAAVAVVKNGDIVFKKGYGNANLEYNIPVTPSTIFPVASVSKQFTVFSLLLLADQGKVSLDDDIRKFIPEVPDFGSKITLRHLATHTSGLREEGDLLSITGTRYGDISTVQNILDLVSSQKELNFKPGDQHLYCNTGFTLLAKVVARVSGQSFAAFTKENIFEPLGMSNTHSYDDYEKIVKGRAYSYWYDGKEHKKGILSSARVGPTGLFTTVEDLSLWVMNFSKLQVGNAKIVTQMNTLAMLNNGKTFGGAYGQYISTYKGLHQIYHGGSSRAGYRAYLGRFPAQEFAVIVLSNYEGTDPNRLSMQVTDLFLKDYMSETNSEEKIEVDSYKKLQAKDLQTFEGYYWDEQRFTPSRIYMENDTLRWSVGGGNGRPLVSIANNTFRRMNSHSNLKLKFEIGEQAKKMKIYIDDLEPIICTNYVPVNYAEEDLAQFAGSFYSEELNTSYTFVLNDGKLIAQHSRIEDIVLAAVQKDMFSGSQSFFSNIKYVRDANNSIRGIQVSSYQAKNLFFEKTAHR
ncbi:MAG: beta-lactamase family protein [Saprospiraceae bacterium]|nr:beta-lactamase family protein [Saprospiraceae bacterium]